MKSKLKSAFIVMVLGGFGMMALPSCSDSDMSLPHVFGDNEVPPEVMAEPRIVKAPDPTDTLNDVTPRLGDVPSKPKDFPPPDAVDELYQQMENDRAESRVIEHNYENPQPTIAPQQQP